MYLHYIEIENSKGEVVSCGTRQPDDHDCEFEVEDGYKIMAFSGVLQILSNDCRLLNLSITSKQLFEDCETTAEISPTYKEVVQQRFEMFNPKRTEFWDQIKRIKAIKLYHGKVIGKEKEINPKYFVLGGIKIVYELKNGDEYENGIDSLKCTNYEQEP